MARKVAVVFVHGIRTGGQGYSDHFQGMLLRRLPRELRGCVVPAEVVWSDIVRGKQTNYLNQLSTLGLRPKAALRQFVIQGLGDAAAYTKPSDRSGAYYEIQDRIRAKVREVESREDPDRPLVFVAHSLGCHIVSSFLWDTRKLRRLAPELRTDPRFDTFQQDFAALDKATPLGRLETVAGLVTFGNNMPIFAFTFQGNDIYTINRPHRNMPPAFPGERVTGPTLDAARWVNIYSRRDPLGYPLGPLTPNYANDPRISDIPKQVESPMSLPFLGMIDAHTKYWRSGFVAKQAADLVKNLINAA